MSALTARKNRKAARRLNVAKRSGATISLNPNDAAAKTLNVIPSEVTVDGTTADGTFLATDGIEFEIPLQTDFTGSVQENDEITYAGKVYVVTAGIRTDALGAVYHVPAISKDVWRGSLA